MGLLVAKQHSSGGCEFACSIFNAQCLLLGYARSGLLLYRLLSVQATGTSNAASPSARVYN